MYFFPSLSVPLSSLRRRARLMAHLWSCGLLALGMSLSGCSSREPEPSTQAPTTKSTTQLIEALRPYSPDASSQPLAELSTRIQRENDLDARSAYLETCVDVLLMGLALESTGADAQAGEWWALLENVTWRHLPPNGQPDEPSLNDPVVRFATAIKGVGRPLLKIPAQAEQTRGLMIVLDGILAQRQQNSHATRLLRERALGTQSGHARAALLMAIQAFPLIAGREHGNRVAGSGAAALTGACKDSKVLDVEDDGARSSLLQLRQWCGFGCTNEVRIGPLARAPIPLTPAVHDTCTAEQWGVRAPADARVLSPESFLGAQFLQDLLVLRRSLEAFESSPLSPTIGAFVEAFRVASESVVVSGGLPFLSERGPSLCGEPIELPRIESAWRALQVTPAILISACGEVRVAEWPNLQIVENQVTLLGSELVFPGAVVAGAVAAPLDKEVLLGRLQSIPEERWPKEATERAVTLVLDSGARAGELTRLLELAHASGFTTANLLVWPIDQTEASRYPSPSFVVLRVEPPPRFTPAVRVTSHSASFLDPRRRETMVPMFELRDYLPDVYGVVDAYAQANPAVEGLSIEFEGEMELQLIVELLASLELRRVGNLMESTEALMSSPPQLDDQGPQRLLGPLFVGR